MQTTEIIPSERLHCEGIDLDDLDLGLEEHQHDRRTALCVRERYSMQFDHGTTISGMSMGAIGRFERAACFTPCAHELGVWCYELCNVVAALLLGPSRILVWGVLGV